MSLFGSVFGDSKDSDPTQAPNQLAEIARALLNEATPLRQGFLDRYSSLITSQTPSLTPIERVELEDLRGQLINPATGQFQTGNEREGNPWDVKRDRYTSLDRRSRLIDMLAKQEEPAPSSVTNGPQFASLKDMIEKQYSRARENIIASTPQGGPLSSALARLEGQRASATAQGIGDLTERETSRAFALATGQTPVALGSLGSAAGSLGQIGAAQSAQQGQALQGIGTGIGLTAGRKAATSSKGSSAGSTAAAAAV